MCHMASAKVHHPGSYRVISIRVWTIFMCPFQNQQGMLQSWRKCSV